MYFSKTGEIPSTPLLVFDGSLSIVLITSDSVIALNVKLCVQGVFRKVLYVLFPVAEMFDASEGPMFVKKLLNFFAISFFSVSIFPSTFFLKNSGSCVLVVVLLVTSLMTFHVFLISFVYFLASADNRCIAPVCSR